MPVSNAHPPIRVRFLDSPDADPQWFGDVGSGTRRVMDDLLETALKAHRAGRFAEAEAIYRAIVAKDASHVDALHLLGLVRNQSGDAEAGERLIRQAIAQRDNAVFRLNLGTLLTEVGRVDEAEAAYRQALRLQPDLADACRRLCVLLVGRGRHVEAEEALRSTLRQRPDDVELLNMLGAARMRTGDLAGAERAFRDGLARDPGAGNLHYNLGNVLDRLGRAGEAEAAFLAAIALTPQHVEARFNLANLLLAARRLDEARRCYEAALAVRPDYDDARFNLGLVQVELEDAAAAEHSFRQILDRSPGRSDARLALSTMLLRRGLFAEGWPLYEARYAADRREDFNKLPEVPYPQWNGEDLTGKSLLVWPEQGYGDHIQFVRFVPELKRRGLRELTLGCHPPLAQLFGTVEGADRVVTDMRQLGNHDYWCLPLSVPLHLGTTLDTVPAAIPYLAAAPALVERWRSRLPPGALRVGLVWKGATIHKNDARRSLPQLATLAPLWSVEGVSFVSLQKGQSEDEARQWASEGRLVHLGSDIGDFADMAAVMSLLDLVISVDTAAAHLAGALGKPCWVLLPDKGADWRWLQGRTDSPWYPGVMRLFRQRPEEGWDGVVTDVITALRDARTSLPPFFGRSSASQESRDTQHLTGRASLASSGDGNGAELAGESSPGPLGREKPYGAWWRGLSMTQGRIVRPECPYETRPRAMRRCRTGVSALMRDIPVVVPSFNNPTYTANMVRQLREFNLNNIIVVDSASTFDGMLLLLDHLESEIRVVRLEANLGPRYILGSHSSYSLLPQLFCLTDPDLEFNGGMPEEFLFYLHELTKRFKVGKVGLALEIADRHSMKDQQMVRDGKSYNIWEFEEQFWQQRLGQLPDGTPVYNANIDTTFALYNKEFYRPESFYDAIRVAGHFTARHLPWYRADIVPIEERSYYKENQKFSNYVQ